MKEQRQTQEVVTPTQYEKLLGILKTAIQDDALVTPDLKRRVIQALIQEIRVTRSGLKLRFFAGVEQIKAGKAKASPAPIGEKKNFVSSSLFYLNGGPTKNRTWN